MKFGKRHGALVVALLAACLSFACNDSKPPKPTTKVEEDPTMPIGTMPGCFKAGASCSSSAQCCGFGVCDSDTHACNGHSCVPGGEHCLTRADCCDPSSVCGGPSNTCL